LAMDETIKSKVDKDMFNVPDNTDWNKDVIEVKAEGKPNFNTGESALEDMITYINDSTDNNILGERVAELMPAIGKLIDTDKKRVEETIKDKQNDLKKR